MFVLDALDQVRYKEPNKNCRLTAIFFARYIEEAELIALLLSRVYIKAYA